MLRVENLDVFYGDVQALSGVSLDVEEGAIVAIVGANGAGKTTLIRAIAGMQRQLTGKIEFRGTDITGWPSYRVCDLGIGQVAEGRLVFPTLTVAENLDVGAMLPRARAARAKNKERVLSLFPVLAERAKQAAGTLSGGEQQMLAIGRCLMGAPELIMFDEPSLGLAPDNRSRGARYHQRAQPLRHHLFAGRAKRRPVAQTGEPSLCAGKRMRHIIRNRRQLVGRRPCPERVFRVVKPGLMSRPPQEIHQVRQRAHTSAYWRQREGLPQPVVNFRRRRSFHIGKRCGHSARHIGFRPPA